jgi:peptide deformylase
MREGDPGATSVAGSGGYNTWAPPRQSLLHPQLGHIMAILKIARMGHPVLLQRAEPVADPGAPEIRRLVADMFETMEDAPGAGLAAPQVHVPLRLFVFRVTPERSSGAPGDTVVGNTVVINPIIEPLTEEKQLRWEGCLSIPGLRAAVPRYTAIRYSGVDCDGNPVAAEVSGFHAGVVQHEYDHLDGILYPMRMTDFRLFGFMEELARLGLPPQSQAASQSGSQPAPGGRR